ncbi:CU044_5270 family protein [Solirubrobacter phytolaccae]|uniref:CU044_5270 family protein n=1 Tax=Solirubrobacter phytolaccae TaxID=1404360 RepID=A0A9X3S6P8_9ACTN|nr:CU044_5270 family protein [Solirubrobacter phytolaccae]MDA0179373.1 CU044_5270 family protein [Solirubrobacter phytolaccae]
MPDILDDLRADLDAAFARAERKRARRGWTFGAATAALASTAVAVVLLAGGTTPPATAAEVLRAVAGVAQDTPAPVPRDDQYYYVRSRTTNLSMFAGVDPKHEHAVTLVEADREIWQSLKRPGQMTVKVIGKRPLTPADAGRRQGPDVAVPGGGRVGKQHHYLLGTERLSRAELLAYPTDPQVVYDRIRAHVGSGGDSREGQVFDAISSALRERPAPPALRAALYGALALTPGVTLAGTVTDRAGRTGTAVAFTEVGVRTELIFDPRTSELLGERRVLVEPARSGIDAPVGTVVGDTAYLERAVVDEL